jgi:hypothetical protein
VHAAIENVPYHHQSNCTLKLFATNVIPALVLLQQQLLHVAVLLVCFCTELIVFYATVVFQGAPSISWTSLACKATCCSVQ